MSTEINQTTSGVASSSENFWEQRKQQLIAQKATQQPVVEQQQTPQPKQEKSKEVGENKKQQQPKNNNNQQQKHYKKREGEKKFYKNNNRNNQKKETQPKQNVQEGTQQPVNPEDADFQTVVSNKGGRRPVFKKKNFKKKGENKQQKEGEKKENKQKENKEKENKEEKKKVEEETKEPVIIPAKVKIFVAENNTSPNTNDNSSWASLLRGSSEEKAELERVIDTNIVASSSSEKKASKQQPNKNNKNKKQHLVDTSKIEQGKKMLSHPGIEFDADEQLIEQGVLIHPRGITNISNSCYMSAVLQSLLFIPQFYYLFKKISKLQLDNTVYPLANKMARFVREFAVMDRNAKHIDASGDVLVPTYILDYMQKVNTDQFILGTQHDAHEFLCYLLETLHQELSKVKPNTSSSADQEKDEATKENVEKKNEWQEVGKKNKPNNVREFENGESMISRLFSGKLKSVVDKIGENRGTAIIEPFYSLHLPIKDDNIHGVRYSLKQMSKEEQLGNKNYRSTKTTIQQLPKVLFLHLKRFDYTDEGAQKISKKIKFDNELVMDEKIIPSIRTISGKSQVKYKLVAVICHHGKEATGGHYSTFVQHGCGKWIHIDDTKITIVSDAHVLEQQAYVLVYVEGEPKEKSPLLQKKLSEKKKSDKKKKQEKKEKQTSSSPNTTPSTTQTTPQQTTQQQ
ncbi:hypothetical protein ABK040_000162 [Willaertia magna]